MWCFTKTEEESILFSMEEKRTPFKIREDAREFLDRNFVMHLATVGKDGAPYVSILVYASDDAFNLYFVTYKHSKKAENIKNDARTSVAIWEHNTLLIQIESSSPSTGS